MALTDAGDRRPARRSGNRITLTRRRTELRRVRSTTALYWASANTLLCEGPCGRHEPTSALGPLVDGAAIGCSCAHHSLHVQVVCNNARPGPTSSGTWVRSIDGAFRGVRCRGRAPAADV